MVVNDLWRSIEPVGLRRRVGLLAGGGEWMFGDICKGRLIRALGSSAPVKEPEVEEDEEFKRKEKRSKREVTGSAAVTGSGSFAAKLLRSIESPVSGSELVWKSGRCLFSNV